MLDDRVVNKTYIIFLTLKYRTCLVKYISKRCQVNFKTLCVLTVNTLQEMQPIRTIYIRNPFLRHIPQHTPRSTPRPTLFDFNFYYGVQKCILIVRWALHYSTIHTVYLYYSDEGRAMRNVDRWFGSHHSTYR